MTTTSVVVESATARKKRAVEWKKFRRAFLLTQRKLADIAGISRRTIQQVEGAKITPHPDTLRVFAVFKKTYAENAKTENFEVNWSEQLDEEKTNG